MIMMLRAEYCIKASLNRDQVIPIREVVLLSSPRT
jgi:hypothetical protein